MSADNGIYILQTSNGAGSEYRVAHLQAVENYAWDDHKKNPDKDYVGDYTDDPDIQIENAREMWKDCVVFNTQEEAFDLAVKMYDEIMQDDMCPIVEYGIQLIKIPREFTPRWRKVKTASRRRK